MAGISPAWPVFYC